MKSLRDVQARHPGFDDRKPQLPPLLPLLPGEDPPPPDYRWVLPMLRILAVCAAFMGLLVFALDQARRLQS